MKDKLDASTLRGSANLARLTPYILTVGAVVLAWQIVIQPLSQRAAVAAAIRIAPGSPLVLRRAAEAELAADRNQNAADLSRNALARSPFDVRALRVVGLTEARAGRTAAADDILTLAGNWSLRDDPAHAWLVEHRLRRGDYASSFAHADTLVRRRADIQPQVFRLFTVAATADPQRVLPVLASLLSAEPPWRSAYLTSLYTSNEGLQTAASLAVMLQAGTAPLSTLELQQFYVEMAGKGQFPALKAVRARLNRPAVGAAIGNGSFDDPTSPEPFQWTLLQKSGAAVEILPDDADPSNAALRVEYDGYSAANLARQRAFLEPGRYSFRSSSRNESGEPARRMAWSVTCAPSGRPLLLSPVVTATVPRQQEWMTSAVEFSVPEGCPSQWIDLVGRPLDSRSPMVVWFDEVGITLVGRGGS